MEMVIWRYIVAYDKVYKRLPKPDEHAESCQKNNPNDSLQISEVSMNKLKVLQICVC
jgi:hypothetical protein